VLAAAPAKVRQPSSHAAVNFGRNDLPQRCDLHVSAFVGCGRVSLKQKSSNAELRANLHTPAWTLSRT
jgi:hypothetical protein